MASIKTCVCRILKYNCRFRNLRVRSYGSLFHRPRLWNLEKIPTVISKYHFIWHSTFRQIPAEISVAQKFENNELHLSWLWRPIEMLRQTSPKVRYRELDVFKILESFEELFRICFGFFWNFFWIFIGKFVGNFLEFFWRNFFWRNFLGGIFLEEFFGRNFLGRFFERFVFGEEFFGRNSLFTLELICLSRFWFLSRFLSQSKEGRKE